VTFISPKNTAYVALPKSARAKGLLFAEETGIRYQTLVGLYLRECVSTGEKLSNTWAAAQASGQRAARFCSSMRNGSIASLVYAWYEIAPGQPMAKSDRQMEQAPEVNS